MEWITDRRPTDKDGVYVYDTDGAIEHRSRIGVGQPWKPIPKCEPYVKPKRFTAKWYNDARCWAIFDGDYIALRMFQFDMESDDGYREAAEEIAAIYEKTMS